MRILKTCLAICIVSSVLSSYSSAQTTPGVPGIRLAPTTLQRLQSVQRLQLATADGKLSTIMYAGDGTGHFIRSSGWMSSNPSQLIHNPNVRKDLELDDNQVKKLEQINKDFQQQVLNGMKEMRSGGKNLDHKKWNKMYQEFITERKTAVGAVLLPHQSKRLKQIAAQMEMRNRGDANALVSKKMADELGIDDEQKKHLKKRSAELQSELAEEIAKLKEKYRDKLIRELRPDQREKLKDMVGEKFSPKKSKRLYKR